MGRASSSSGVLSGWGGDRRLCSRGTAERQVISSPCVFVAAGLSHPPRKLAICGVISLALGNDWNEPAKVLVSGRSLRHSLVRMLEGGGSRLRKEKAGLLRGSGRAAPPPMDQSQLSLVA